MSEPRSTRTCSQLRSQVGFDNPLGLCPAPCRSTNTTVGRRWIFQVQPTATTCRSALIPPSGDGGYFKSSLIPARCLIQDQNQRRLRCPAPDSPVSGAPGASSCIIFFMQAAGTPRRNVHEIALRRLTHDRRRNFLSYAPPAGLV